MLEEYAAWLRTTYFDGVTEAGAARGRRWRSAPTPRWLIAYSETRTDDG
jgi:hypothetical protein